MSKLSEQQFQALKESIKNNGQYIPIIVNQNGVLIDGHHRYRACSELGLEPEIQVKCFDDPLLELLYIKDINGKRRHMTDAQKIEFGHKFKHLYQKLAEKNQSLAGKLYGKGKGNSSDSSVSYETQLSSDSSDSSSISSPISPLSPTLLSPIGRVDKVIAKDIGVSATTFFRGETLIDESPQEWEKVKSGKITVNEGYNEYKRQKNYEQSKKEALEKQATIPLPEGFKLINGDFIEYGKDIPDNSVGAIVTDPPYDRHSLFLYDAAFKLAARVLKPGAPMVFYFGNGMLHEILDCMRNAGLRYNGLIAVKMTGKHAILPEAQMYAGCKFMLYCFKGEKLAESIGYTPTFIESKPPEKQEHPWEQSVVEAQEIIDRITLENEIILDPMMGIGTNGRAALKLGRKFIGIEKNLVHFGNAKGKIIKEREKLLLSADDVNNNNKMSE